MPEEWLVSRAGSVFGPYSWERVLELAREGSIGLGDLVLRPGSEEWADAASVPAFFPPAVTDTIEAGSVSPAALVELTPSAHVVRAPAGPLEDAAVSQASETPRSPQPGRKRVRKLVLAAIGLIVVLGLGAAAYVFLPDMFPGTIRYTPPSKADAIDTQAYGRVQRNRIGISLEAGATRADVERLATQMKGTIVGEWEDLGLYLIEFPNSTEKGLTSALETAAKAPGVGGSFPDEGLAQP